MIGCCDYRDFLSSLDCGSVDLALTDPPYGISRKTNFHTMLNKQWNVIDMEFGDWDATPPDYPALASLLFQAVRSGGSVIVWCAWQKVTSLVEAIESAGFSKVRMVIWERSNPVPINARATNLSNSRDVAVSAVKGSGQTFNGHYDNGVYRMPIPRKRIHPTQKPLALFRELIKKHSNRGDLVIDPFLGSGTTALAALNEGRRFAGCDIDADWVSAAKMRVAQLPLAIK